jgi:4-oxalocrotonate tautomerase
MPLVKVSLLKGKTKEYKQAIRDSLYQGFQNGFNIKDDSLFTLINEYEKENFLFPKNYLDIDHTDDLIIIEIVANIGRTQEQKKILYSEINLALVRTLNIRSEDIIINIVEVPKDNWSMGNGVAAFV